jgi:tyrosine-protein kinase
LHADAKPSDDWFEPAVDQSGLKRFLETIRAKLGLVLAILTATVLVAVIYLLVANKVYEAEAKLLISPVPATDTSLSGLGLIRESADPTLDVETAAQLVTTPQVADAAAGELDNGSSPEDLLSKVKADPVGQSNIVAVVAEASTPQAAADLANAFAKGVVDVRTNDLDERIDAVLPPLKKQLETMPEGSSAADSLAQQVTQLESLRAGDDPTFRFETPATPPDGPTWPRPLLTIIAAIILGMALGAAAAFIARMLDPRLKREQQLREIFRLPILARIPQEPGAQSDLPLRPLAISAATLEAYRTLRATITAPGPGDSRPRSFMVTSPSPSDGKTSTAVNLATALASGGARTILIEADLRRPMLARTMGFSPPHSVTSVLRGEVSLTDALIRAPGLSENLALLMADRAGGDSATAELFGLPAGERMVEEAESIADCVVVDSPPLTAVVDALPLARDVDSLLIVVRLGKTHLRRIRDLGELLAGNGISPTGFAVVGTARPRGIDYYYQQGATKNATKDEPKDEPDSAGSEGGSKKKRGATAKL